MPQPSSLGYCFEKRDREVWVLWDHEKPCQVSIPVAGDQVALIDLMGCETRAEVHKGRLAVRISGEPVFVEVGR